MLNTKILNYCLSKKLVDEIDVNIYGKSRFGYCLIKVKL